MTWVIGVPSSLGYGVAISDIRVTFSNGQTRDCLQKVHFIAPFFVAGFSGSVLFGFRSIEDLQKQFSGLGPEHAWIPGWAAFKWYRRARRALAKAPNACKVEWGSGNACRCITNRGHWPTGWARSTVAIMRSPDFFPQILALNEISAIGSGSGVELYIKELKDLQRDRNTLWKMEIRNPGGYGTMLLDILQQTIQNHPTPGSVIIFTSVLFVVTKWN